MTASAPRIVTRYTACPHDCPDTCGILADVDLDTGRLVAVRGNPDHPYTRGSLCGKVNRYVERVYSADRVLYPMKRVGAKGASSFERISWDEALDLVVGKFRETAERYGAEAIMPYSYGGTMGVVNHSGMDCRFFNRMGATLLERTICSAAGGVGYGYTMGAMMGADPESAAEAKLIIAWGVNLVSTNLHQLPFIQEARRKGAQLVHIDVHRNQTAEIADRFVQAEASERRYIEELGKAKVQVIQLSPEDAARAKKLVREKVWPKLAKLVGEDIITQIKANAEK